IDSVQADCDCITLSHPKERLRPGQAGEIALTFLTADMEGKQVFYIHLASNGSTEPKTLSITAEVLPQ
ncbi:MAG: DUF1573 domain-containing protein, partial [Flavobacteriales bacterium]